MSSKIKLIIEKGSREGETLEYNSTSAIKIGRVVRGNTIAIKDAGISSKHICIQFDNQLLQWTLTDLDSSNGTILNGMNVKPSVSSCLSDGDCIQIGELTSMIVRIGTELEVVGPCEKRNTRRNGRGRAGVAVVESELGLGFDEGKAVEEVAQKRNLRPRGRKVAVVEEENEKEKVVEVEPVQKRDPPGRGRKVGVVVVENEKEKAVEVELVQKRDPPSRARKLAVVVEENEKEKVVEDELVQKRDPPGRARKLALVVEEIEKEMAVKQDQCGRGKKGVEVESKKGVVEVDVQRRDLRTRGKKNVDVKIHVEHLSCKRVLRGSKKGENMNVDVRKTGEDVSALMEPKNTRGGRKKLPVKAVGDSDIDGGKLVENGVLVEDKRTGRGRLRRKKVVESLEENDAKESVQVSEGNKGDFDKSKADLVEKVENMGLVENLDANNKFVQDHLVVNLSQWRGIPNTNRKYREDKKVSWHDTPFETRLERALNRDAAEAL